ncbi:putative cellulase [Hesseltinella vesiculosa]|uniref:Putative cellulase n=1 Tax=Hesseltinella vesiculosa TaxID=101127 RepID=A0A1X2GKS0_9FUNG|nr:putative cellulase [Hesseltinella vesiculosa]
MHLTSVIITALAGFNLQQVYAATVDPKSWYDQHPGLARINKVDQSSNQIVDEFGRVRFFHGTNVVMKESPWYRPSGFSPGNSFGLQDVQNLRDLGVNSIRLGHHASAEPVRGQYNMTFMDIMKQQTKMAEDHGIYVLVDVHQDLLAGQFCGHGVPPWFVKKGWVSSAFMYPFPTKLIPFPVDSNGMPTPPSICGTVNWGLTYTTVAVGNAFGRLYTNYDGLGDAFASYWKLLATQYSNTNNIIGYNLLNEPWVGDSYYHPELLTPGVADHEMMEGLWNSAATQIRSVDNNTLIWFEGSTYDILSGFNNVPLGDGSKTVQSFHYYNPPQVGSVSTTIQNRLKDNQRLKTASVMTEFTMWMGDANQMSGMVDAVTSADTYMMSWMGWAYENLYNSSRMPYPELQAHYSRAYPTAVAGTPTSFKFDESTATFNLVYNINASNGAPTEIMLSPLTYPNGYNVTMNPAQSLVTYTVDNRTLALFPADSTQDGTSITVTITKN